LYPEQSSGKRVEPESIIHTFVELLEPQLVSGDGVYLLSRDVFCRIMTDISKSKGKAIWPFALTKEDVAPTWSTFIPPV
jgi:hypothetical protein